LSPYPKYKPNPEKVITRKKAEEKKDSFKPMYGKN